MTQKNVAVAGGAVLLAIGIMNVSDPAKRGFSFQSVIGTWLPLLLGAIMLYQHLR